MHALSVTAFTPYRIDLQFGQIAAPGQIVVALSNVSRSHHEVCANFTVNLTGFAATRTRTNCWPQRLHTCMHLWWLEALYGIKFIFAPSSEHEQVCAICTMVLFVYIHLSNSIGVSLSTEARFVEKRFGARTRFGYRRLIPLLLQSIPQPSSPNAGPRSFQRIFHGNLISSAFSHSTFPLCHSFFGQFNEDCR